MRMKRIRTKVFAVMTAVGLSAVPGCAGTAESGAAQCKLENLQWRLEDAEAGTLPDPQTVAAMDQRELFAGYEISREILERIDGRSYMENPDISLDELRYLKVLHYNFDHEIQVGELIVNAELEEVFLEIFEELYESEYEIQSMYLIDNYWAGSGEDTDTASIEDNNTSAFCYRTITGGAKLSNHALGRAIDINPMQNPYITYRDGEAVWFHENADRYIDRNSGLPHLITHEDRCFEIFTEHGFIWGGDWENPKDYQHFEWKEEK